MDLIKKGRIMLFPRLNKWIVILFVVALSAAGVRSYQLYHYIFDANIYTPGSIIIPQNATYEQKDPLLIYKFESFNLFKIMVAKVNKSIVSILAKGHIPISDPQQVHEGHERRGLDLSKLSTSKSELPTSSSSSSRPDAPQEPKVVQPIRVEKRVGRNDPCPCGSGKKFKSCHGKDLVD